MQGLHGLHGRVGAATGVGREKQEIWNGDAGRLRKYSARIVLDGK
jgi:hypothetical protein